MHWIHIILRPRGPHEVLVKNLQILQQSRIIKLYDLIEFAYWMMTI